MNQVAAALAFHDTGACVVPVRADGTKTPAGAWKHRQTQRPTREEVNALAGTHTGIGLICGAISGNLEMFELEGRAVKEGLVEQLAQLMTSHGHSELWQRLNTGYLEITPTGGLHWLYRVDGQPRGNLKLARRPATPTELEDNPADRIKVLAETRGEGGFVVVAPSAGTTHPTGQAWTLLAGGAHTIPTLTVDERDLLHALAAMLDQMPTEDVVDQPAIGADRSVSPQQPAENLRPGDDYNTRADWADILTDWTRTKDFGGGAYGWTRPGKNARDGISATTGTTRDGHDRLYVFSSSTDFDTEKPYSKFAAYTQLQHAGDWKTAAKTLRGQGYGAPLEPSRPLKLVHSDPDTQTPTATDGATALKVSREDSELPAILEVTLTDQGNAQLLVNRHGHRLRYVPARGNWLRWDGTRWAWCDDDSEAIEAAAETIHAIQPSDDLERKHQTRSLSRRGLEAATALTRRDRRIRLSPDQLDADAWALNTPTGVVNLWDGSVRPSTPSDLLTRITGAPYDPTARAPKWQRFLADTFDGDEHMTAFVQRLAGYSACGVVLHHVLPFLHGSGGNGKTVFLDTVVAVLGDYASTAPAGFLMAQGREDESATARLAGLRLVVCSEVNQTAKFDEAKVKLLTGGDRLTARFLYGRHFTFTPSHTLWLMGNHQPRVDAGGDSFWRRLRLLPFTHQVSKEKRIEGLAEQLVAEEAPGILAWIVQGAIDARKHGLQEPEQVMAATKTYAEEEDALARFVADRCHVGGGQFVKVSTADMRSAYVAWCREEGEKEVSPQVFGRELRTRINVEIRRSNGRKFYTNIALLEDTDTAHWSDR